MDDLLKRVAAERRAVLVLLGAVLLVNLLAFVIAVRPLMLKSAGAADRASAAAVMKSNAERELAQARQLVSGTGDAQQELAAFYSKVLPTDLTSARRMTYASLPALAEKTGVIYDRRTTNVEEPTRDERLAEMKIRMVLRGDYTSLREFVYELERSPEFIIIDDISLTQTNENELTLLINLSTYFRQDANGS
jgi:Tfp pilus assembly protein PilO